MKVLMVGRIDLFDAMGGDKVQIENTAAELRKLGVDVDISTDLSADMTAYDVIHIFQLDWVSEPYFYARKAKELCKPVVLSPIHHSVKEVKRFDNEYAFDFRRISKILFRNQYNRDTFKNVYRSLFSPKKLPPTLTSVVFGLKNMHKKALEKADVVLVQTKAEVNDLKHTYGVDFEWEKIPNGVGSQFLKSHNYENTLNIENYIMVVGRIEPRKNQLSVIKAVEQFRKEKGIDVSLVFVGKKSTQKHFEYILRFNNALRKYDWIKHIPYVPYKNIQNVYHFAKVGVSASWFETTGLTSLEALVSGANAVASGERAKEYLGRYVSYCDPGDINSIKEAIEKEYFAKRPSVNSDMLEEYTWENAAKKTLEVYTKVINRHVV